MKRSSSRLIVASIQVLAVHVGKDNLPVVHVFSEEAIRFDWTQDKAIADENRTVKCR